jgi:hypothetical protein
MKRYIHLTDQSALPAAIQRGRGLFLVSRENKGKRSAAFIQWNASNIWMDIYCECGQVTHIEADFCYRIKCANCGRVYSCDPHIRLRPLKTEPGDTLTTCRD